MGGEDAEGAVKLGGRTPGISLVPRDLYAGADTVGLTTPKPIAERERRRTGSSTPSSPIAAAFPDGRALPLRWFCYRAHLYRPSGHLISILFLEGRVVRISFGVGVGWLGSWHAFLLPFFTPRETYDKGQTT